MEIFLFFQCLLIMKKKHRQNNSRVLSEFILNKPVNLLMTAVTSHKLSSWVSTLLAAMLKQQQRQHVHQQETHLKWHRSDFPLTALFPLSAFHGEEQTHLCTCQVLTWKFWPLVSLKFFPVWFVSCTRMRIHIHVINSPAKAVIHEDTQQSTHKSSVKEDCYQVNVDASFRLCPCKCKQCFVVSNTD